MDKLNAFIEDLSLIDVWRERNPDIKNFTYSKYNSNSPKFVARRLDYIFVSQSLTPFCRKTDIYSIALSDHRGVFLEMDFSSFERGPPNFKINVSLLKNIDFINELKKEIAKVKNLQDQLDPHSVWELTKIKIKTLSKFYGKKSAAENKCTKQMISDELSQYEKNLLQDPDNLTLITKVCELKKKLDVFMVRETEGARIRAGIRWAEHGEKCSALFLGLEKQKARNETIYKIRDEEGNLLNENDQILQYLARYYENLYVQPPQTQLEKVEGLFCVPDPEHQLNDEEADQLEAPVTLAEVHQALSGMNNGSSPGLDGIPAEDFPGVPAEGEAPLNARHIADCTKLIKGVL